MTDELAARLVNVRDGHIDSGANGSGPDTLPADPVGQNGRRRLGPADRLALLCDPGSLQTIRSEIVSERMGAKAREGDGVVGGWGRIAGRLIACYAQDATYAGGSLGAAQAQTILRVQRTARRARVPLVGFVESAGARLQEGLAALDGYAAIFTESVAMSGLVPQISVLTGTSAGGGSYSPALTDFVIMTEAAAMFLTGPRVVGEVTGESTSVQDLGGSRVHSRNGVCHLVCGTDVDSIFLVRQLLGYLPQHAAAAPAVAIVADPAGPDPGGSVPTDPRRAYDVREAALGIFDADSILEISPHWGPSMVTALVRLEGRPVGLIANQPRHMGGVIDAEASQKAARFVRTCNAFGLPLVVLVDTPGFLPGRDQEQRAIIRHGAKLLHAFAEATVPRITVVLRKAYGGAYITMNSRNLGADLVLAWSRAELGIMGAEQAIGLIHKRDIAAAADPDQERRRLATHYANEHLNAHVAARRGHVDEVILPGETRPRIAAALATLSVQHSEPRRLRIIPQ